MICKLGWEERTGNEMDRERGENQSEVTGDGDTTRGLNNKNRGEEKGVSQKNDGEAHWLRKTTLTFVSRSRSSSDRSGGEGFPRRRMLSSTKCSVDELGNEIFDLVRQFVGIKGGEGHLQEFLFSVQSHENLIFLFEKEKEV
jgi:hypothetical protein